MASLPTDFRFLFIFPSFLRSKVTLQLVRHLLYKVYSTRNPVYLWQIKYMPKCCIVSLYYFCHCTLIYKKRIDLDIHFFSSFRLSIKCFFSFWTLKYREVLLVLKIREKLFKYLGWIENDTWSMAPKYAVDDHSCIFYMHASMFENTSLK